MFVGIHKNTRENNVRILPRWNSSTGFPGVFMDDTEISSNTINPTPTDISPSSGQGCDRQNKSPGRAESIFVRSPLDQHTRTVGKLFELKLHRDLIYLMGNVETIRRGAVTMLDAMYTCPDNRQIKEGLAIGAHPHKWYYIFIWMHGALSRDGSLLTECVWSSFEPDHRQWLKH